MRYLSAACLLLALTAQVSADGSTPRRDASGTNAYTNGAGDANWIPPSFGLSTTADAGAAPMQSISRQASDTKTQAFPAPPAPKQATAVWKWAAYQVCVTTCHGGLCDANQWQVCEGDACTMKERGCYAVWNGSVPGGFSREPGTLAGDGCYSMITTKNAALCYR